MRIKDVKWVDVPMWPPQWWTTGQGNDEEGLLEGVYFSKDKMPFCISVDANHLGAEKRGIIIMEDPAHLDALYQILKENIGKSLTEIGDLEINFFPSIPKKGPKTVQPQTERNSNLKKSI